MNSHALGERAGWVLAAAFVAFGSTTIGGADRPASTPLGSPTAQTGTAAVDSPALVDRYLFGDAAGSPTSWAGGPAAALAADAFAWPSASPTVVAIKPATVAKPAAPKPAAVWWAKYQGTNHVWMPTLGISKPVYLFPCSRGTAPDNLVYRWGCAGTNNVYLLGHAYGVFKALHDAYYNGKLKVGMPVIYADGSGHEHLYRVTTWRVVSPVDAAWAIASQPLPSMTLQTCVGADGSQRLNVRLVEVKA